MLIDCIQQGSRDENVQGKNAVSHTDSQGPKPISTVCVFDQVSGESRPPEKSDISSDKQSVMKKIRLCLFQCKKPLLLSFSKLSPFFFYVLKWETVYSWVVTQRKTL